jgi:hypothetical protein
LPETVVVLTLKMFIELAVVTGVGCTPPGQSTAGEEELEGRVTLNPPVEFWIISILISCSDVVVPPEIANVVFALMVQAYQMLPELANGSVMTPPTAAGHAVGLNPEDEPPPPPPPPLPPTEQR